MTNITNNAPEKANKWSKNEEAFKKKDYLKAQTLKPPWEQSTENVYE